MADLFLLAQTSVERLNIHLTGGNIFWGLTFVDVGNNSSQFLHVRNVLALKAIFGQNFMCVLLFQCESCHD